MGRLFWIIWEDPISSQGSLQEGGIRISMRGGNKTTKAESEKEMWQWKQRSQRERDRWEGCHATGTEDRGRGH